MDDKLYGISCFSGVGGLDVALGKDVKTVCYIENNPYCQEILRKNIKDGWLDPAPIWSDIQSFKGRPWNGKVDIVFGGFPCFAGDTRILTKRGHIPIAKIKIGDYVLTHKGRWRTVTDKMQRNSAPLRKISGGRILETLTTDEHPYYTRKRLKVWINEKRTYKRIFNEPQWTPAKNIDRLFVGSILPPIEFKDNHTKEFWWLVGRYLADGWLVKRNGRKNGRTVICCNKKESETLKKRILVAGFNCTEVEERTCIKFHVTKGSLYRFLLDFGKYSYGKMLPISALSLDQEKSKELFDGWASGDGYRNEKKSFVTVTTTSCSLALDMAIIAQRAYGRVASIYKTNMPSKCTIEGRICNQRTQYSLRLCNKNRVSFIDGEYSWCQIRKSELCGTGDVFNISVDEDESYIANGAIVHNCQDISVAGKGEGIKEGNRSGLWFEMYRIIKEVHPRYVFLENVAGIRRRGLREVLECLSEAGYNAEWTMLGAKDVGAPHKRERWFCLATLANAPC